MSTRTIPIKVKNEYIVGDGVLVGAAGSHNDVVLRMEFSSLWDGLAKTVQFRDALNENIVDIILTADKMENWKSNVYLVPIPYGAKTNAGRMTVSIKGVLVGEDNTTARATLAVSGWFEVAESDWDEDGQAEGDITPTQAEQLQAQVEIISGLLGETMPSVELAVKSAAAAEQSATNAETAKIGAETAKAAAQRAATTASSYAATANTAKSGAESAKSGAETARADAEAWAVGQRNGVDVPKTDPTYQNNARWWAGHVKADTGTGLSPEAAQLLIDILKAALYNANISSSVAQLAGMLGAVVGQLDAPTISIDYIGAVLGQAILGKMVLGTGGGGGMTQLAAPAISLVDEQATQLATPVITLVADVLSLATPVITITEV